MRYDVAIVGAGIAGASLAAEAAPHASVLPIAAEDAPGYHATGRSAAIWSESSTAPHIHPITTASGAAFRSGWDWTGDVSAKRGSVRVVHGGSALTKKKKNIKSR